MIELNTIAKKADPWVKINTLQEYKDAVEKGHLIRVMSAYGDGYKQLNPTVPPGLTTISKHIQAGMYYHSNRWVHLYGMVLEGDVLKFMSARNLAAWQKTMDNLPEDGVKLTPVHWVVLPEGVHL